MDDGRQPPNKKETRKPTWTEYAVPETVRPAAPTRPLPPGDPEALVPAADPIVQAAYGRTGHLPARPLLAREGDAADALVIQKTAKQTRVLNFHVEGIHWRAGFAPEVSQTPLNQYLPVGMAPPEAEQQAGNGFVLRPVERALEAVLRDLVPAKLLAVGEEMFGPLRELAGMYLYYVPQGAGATIGMLAWYAPSLAGKGHVFYLQTDVKKGSPRLLDDMHRTFLASLAARAGQAGDVRPLDFWQELRLASTQLEHTIRNSSLGRNSAEVKGLVSAARHEAENRLYDGLVSGFSAAGRIAEFVCLILPQRLLALVVRLCAQGMVGAIRGLDRMIAPRSEEP